jgi:transcriptional regulator with XRE-family HTH domain
MRALTLERAFAEALRQARRRRGLTQEQLAFAAGLDRTAISLLERARRSPSLETVFLIAEALNIPAADFVAETVEQIRRGARGGRSAT